MFTKFHLAAAILALGLFVHAQRQGWNLFEDAAESHGGSGSSQRISHK